MDRRDFLRSLAAIGTTVAINPRLLASASEQEIETAWQSLQQSPRVFYVGEYGTLSSEFGIDYSTTRATLFGLDEPPTDTKALIQYIAGSDVIECRVEDLLYLDGDEEIIPSWQETITSNRGARERVIEDLKNWIHEWPDELDWERADLNGSSGRGDALQFFEGQPDTAKLFNVQTIYGDHPGSTYYAAELHMGLDEANALAEHAGLPIRFEWDEF